jgi:hypothetical protein
MTKPLVTFGDPERLVIDYLKAAFAPRAEAYKPATVTDSFPTAALTTQTHVQVELEHGNVDDYPATERAQVRVTCYAGPGKRTTVKSLASLAQGLLYTHPGDGSVAGTVPLLGRSDVITDPTTKNLMVWFSFRVNLKAAPAAP